jgi:hypothetical protein
MNSETGFLNSIASNEVQVAGHRQGGVSARILRLDKVPR